LFCYFRFLEPNEFMNRRSRFLKTLLASLATGPLWASAREANPLPPYHPAHDDHFWSAVRNNFPLERDRVYFNNGSFGPSPYPVLRAIEDKLASTNRTGEYGHTDTAREALADFLSVPTETLSLTHNTTEGLNIACWGLPLQAGDEVLITLQEHVGNALPWLRRAELHGIVLKPFELAPTAAETLDRIRRNIGPRTRVLALPHITCTTGQVLPLREICALARERGLFTAIDGAHGPGTLDLDLQELGCDTYATCAHKWLLGPAGTGMLYVRREILEEIRAFHVGAYSDTGWSLTEVEASIESLVPTAHRYDYGTQSVPLYHGAAAAATFLREVGTERIEARVRRLNDLLYAGLTELGDRIELLTPAEAASRIAMVSFRPRNMDYRSFFRQALQAGFRVRVVPESGLNAIRVSTHIYNSAKELDRFLAHCHRVL
jgi:cysteine desulfurase / selenocysteine lyase